MKKMKVNMLALIAVAIAAVTMSFNLATPATNPWHFVGDSEDEGEYANEDNWEEGLAPGSTCITTGTKPCNIVVPAANKPALGLYLQDLSNDEVMEINPGSTRP